MTTENSNIIGFGFVNLGNDFVLNNVVTDKKDWLNYFNGNTSPRFIRFVKRTTNSSNSKQVTYVNTSKINAFQYLDNH